MLENYVVQVFDSRPADGGGDAWSVEFELAVAQRPVWAQSSIAFRNANASECDLLESEVRLVCADSCDYESGSVLWLQLHDDECGSICWPMTL